MQSCPVCFFPLGGFTPLTLLTLTPTRLLGAGKDPVRVAAGLKAAIHNPNVSEEAKERAAERLEGNGAGISVGDEVTDQHTHRVMGGYKATLTSTSSFRISVPSNI